MTPSSVVPEVSHPEPVRHPGRAWLRAAVLLGVIGGGLALAFAVDLPSVPTVRSWLDAGRPERWFAVALMLALALLTPVSRTALSVLVGAVAGFPAGLALALGGGLLGGLAGFGLSRWLGRAAVLRLAGSRVAQVDRLVAERGFATVLTARLMPVAPFVVVSYAAGLSGVRLGPYVLGTAVGLVPWSVLYVGLGASAAQVGSWAAVLDIALPLAALIAATLIGGTVWWRRHSRMIDGGRRPAEPG